MFYLGPEELEVTRVAVCHPDYLYLPCRAAASSRVSPVDFFSSGAVAEKCQTGYPRAFCTLYPADGFREDDGRNHGRAVCQMPTTDSPADRSHTGQ